MVRVVKYTTSISCFAKNCQHPAIPITDICKLCIQHISSNGYHWPSSACECSCSWGGDLFLHILEQWKFLNVIHVPVMAVPCQEFI